MYGTLSQIEVENPHSWKGVVFLTIDIDWAHDDLLYDTINLLKAHEVPATWFVTHDTPALEALRSNSSFELGIHPNFNKLLSGLDDPGASMESEIDRLLEIVPEAKSVRSHSMTQSSVLLNCFRERGLKVDSNQFLAASSGIPCRPYLHWNGLVRVPYSWEDDIHWLDSQSPEINEYLARAELKVLDFHPIHIFLNTESADRYETSRPFHRNPEELLKYRYEGYGTRNRFLEVLNLG